MLEITGYLKLG